MNNARLSSQSHTNCYNSLNKNTLLYVVHKYNIEQQPV